MGQVTSFFVCFLTTVRYCILPVMICIDDEYMSYCPLDANSNATYFYNGVYFTMLEAILFGFFIWKVFPKWYNNTITETLTFESENTKVLFFEMAILLILVSLTPSVLENYSLMFNLKSSDDLLFEEEKVSSGLMETISVMGVRCLKIIAPIPIVLKYYRKYSKTQNPLYFAISAFTLIFMYALIMEGNARNTIIIPAISLIFILTALFPQHRKKIWTSMVCIIISISVTSIIYKVFSNNVTNMVNASSLSYWIMYFEVYFAGIPNMGKVVAAKDLYPLPFNPIMIWNDITQSMPILSNFCDYNNTSDYYYFREWGRNDQIIPSSGNGIFYLGYYLGPIVPMLVTRIAYKFEQLSKKSRFVSEYIAYTFACTTVSYNIFNSVSSLFMKLSITILPVILIILINKKVNLRR